MPDLLDSARELEAFAPRAPCSDAERRAARWTALALRQSGRDVVVETHWVWRAAYWPWIAAMLAAIGASLAAPSHPGIGLAAAGGALALTVLDLAGVPLMRIVQARRATALVHSPAPPSGAPVELVLTAALDVPRAGIAHGPAVARWQRATDRATRGLAPSGRGWAVLAIAGVAAVCGARLAGADGTGIALVQLVPTLALLIGVALALDVALSEPATGAGEDAAVAALLVLADELARVPPRNLRVSVVAAGAGSVGHPALRAHLRARRRELRPAGTAVLELRPCASGVPAWWSTSGAILPRRFHPRMRAAAAQVAASEHDLGAVPAARVGDGAAATARARRLPALAVGALPGAGAIDPAALRATVEFALAVVDELDAGL